MTIDEAKQYIQGKARQNQVGHVPIDKLNIFFERAQLEVVDALWSQVEVNQTIVDEISPITTTVNLNPTVINAFKGNKYTIPSNFMHLLNLERTYFINPTATTDSEIRDLNIELLTNAEFNARLGSQINFPNSQYPIAKQVGNEWIVVTGVAANFSLIATYVRKPITPKWAFTVSSGQEIYDAGNSINFELPETTHNEICEKVLSYIGVSTRDMELYQPSEQQQAKGV